MCAAGKGRSVAGSSAQCAAVTTAVGEISEPVQPYVEPSDAWAPTKTAYGQEPAGAVLPPTTNVDLLIGRPPRGGAAAAGGGGGGAPAARGPGGGRETPGQGGRG